MLTFATTTALASAAAPQPISFGDFAKVVRISDPQISPDGKRIAVVVRRVDMKGDSYKTEIDLVDAATGAMRPLTQGRDHVGAPRWSPDGSQLAFVTLPACASQPYKAKPQVFAFPMNGGDPRQLTHAPNGVESYAWRPDGRAIAYAMPDNRADQAAIKAHRDLFTVGDQDFLSQSAPVASHVWLQTLVGSASQITSGTPSLGSGQFASDLSWSADGKRIAFTELPDAYNGHFGRARACVVDVPTKTTNCVTEAGAFSQSPTFAPTGDAMVYSAAHDGYWSIDLDAMVRKGDRTWRIAPGLDRDIHWAAWTPNADALWLAADDRTTVGLWHAPLHGSPHRVDLGDVTFLDGNVGRDGAVAFTGATSRDPSELYYLAPGATSQLEAYERWAGWMDKYLH